MVVGKIPRSAPSLGRSARGSDPRTAIPSANGGAAHTCTGSRRIPNSMAVNIIASSPALLSSRRPADHGRRRPALAWVLDGRAYDSPRMGGDETRRATLLSVPRAWRMHLRIERPSVGRPSYAGRFLPMEIAAKLVNCTHVIHQCRSPFANQVKHDTIFLSFRAFARLRSFLPILGHALMTSLRW